RVWTRSLRCVAPDLHWAGTRSTSFPRNEGVLRTPTSLPSLLQKPVDAFVFPDFKCFLILVVDTQADGVDRVVELLLELFPGPFHTRFERHGGNPRQGFRGPFTCQAARARSAKEASSSSSAATS